MNLSHTVKVVGSVVLSAVMAGSMMPVTVFAQNNDENPTEKSRNCLFCIKLRWFHQRYNRIELVT